MNICIGGGSGFIGQYLTEFFGSRGHRVRIIHRTEWDRQHLNQYLQDADILMNFVGEPIPGRWTRNKKKRILDSRVQSANTLALLLKEGKLPVKLWINASAVGIYDSHHVHREDSCHVADNFLAEVVQHWEDPVLTLNCSDIRTIVLRLGVVLGNGGGIMQPLMRAARVKSGLDIRIHKVMPFIHIHDLARAILFAMENPVVKGVVNAVSPEQITTREFFSAFNRAVKPWIVFPVSKIWMQRILGESTILFTGGQQVVPYKLQQAGFLFDFPDLSSALKDILHFKHTV